MAKDGAYKGKLIVNKTKAGKKLYGKIESKESLPSFPPFYELDEKHNNKECEFEILNGQIKKISIDGIELPNSHQDLPDGTKSNNILINNYSIEHSKLPADTKRALKGFEDKIDNYALKLNKTVNFIYNMKNQKEEVTLFKSEYKKKKFEIDFDFNKNSELINDIINRQEMNIKIICNECYKEYKSHPDWRLIVGLGSESVYETSITLHHIYGIPYIPGQAVKGVVRNYIINEQFAYNYEGNNELEHAEKRALNDPAFCHLFGSPKDSAVKEQQGAVIFFDAFPINVPEIKPDVMNPHYGPYYSEGKPPADYHNPIPIFFLTVSKNTSFRFYIGIKPKNYEKIKEVDLTRLINNTKLKKYNGLLEVSEYWLHEALKEHGIGAKTAVGYGYMH